MTAIYNGYADSFQDYLQVLIKRYGEDATISDLQEDIEYDFKHRRSN